VIQSPPGAAKEGTFQVQLTMRAAVLFCFTIAPGFAESWTGALVDSNCYDSLERNSNPFETSPGARDRDYQIRYCSPKTKTKKFGIVLDDWTRLMLNPAGNSKVVELVKKTGRKSPFPVVVTGERGGEMIRVDSISIRPRESR
jgi:hypothetical protein